jgi:hypothetical protein
MIGSVGATMLKLVLGWRRLHEHREVELEIRIIEDAGGPCGTLRLGSRNKSAVASE